MKVLVSHVEEGPELFYVHICRNETIEGLQYLEKMTSDLNKVSYSMAMMVVSVSSPTVTIVIKEKVIIYCDN